jgi:hypothetical protein
LLWQSYDDLFLLWCHLFTVRCHFLTDNILTELQGISLNDAKISSRTVRRRLNFEGYKKHPVCKKTTISPVNREKRKRFCRSKLMWTVRNHWKKVILNSRFFLPLPLCGKFSSDPRTRRLPRNLLIVLLFFPIISAIL